MQKSILIQSDQLTKGIMEDIQQSIKTSVNSSNKALKDELKEDFHDVSKLINKLKSSIIDSQSESTEEVVSNFNEVGKSLEQAKINSIQDKKEVIEEVNKLLQGIVQIQQTLLEGTFEKIKIELDIQKKELHGNLENVEYKVISELETIKKEIQWRNQPFFKRLFGGNKK